MRVGLARGLAGHLGEEFKVERHARAVEPTDVTAGNPCVEGFEIGDFIHVFQKNRLDLQQYALALIDAHVRPGTFVEGCPRGPHCGVNLVVVGLAQERQDFPGRRAHDRQSLTAAVRNDAFAPDETGDHLGDREPGPAAIENGGIHWFFSVVRITALSYVRGWTDGIARGC